MHRKCKLHLNHETLKILASPELEYARGGFLTTIIIIADTGPTCNPPPPRTNSIAPCCGSNDHACPAE